MDISLVFPKRITLIIFTTLFYLQRNQGVRMLEIFKRKTLWRLE